MSFWRTEIWDPVAGEFGALPFIWGTLYSSVLALLIATPIALGIAIFISELCPAGLRQPLVFLTELLAAIPSIVYGLWGIFVLVPAVRAVESVAARLAAAAAALHRAAARRRHAVGGADPGDHGDPVHLVGRARGAQVGAAGAARRRLRARRDAVRGDPRRLFYARTGIVGAVMLGFGRALGETMAVTMVIGNNPQVSVSLFAPQYTMAAVIANEFTEAADELYLSALVEIGLVLFIITLIVNSLSRLLIWSMARSRDASRRSRSTAEAAA